MSEASKLDFDGETPTETSRNCFLNHLEGHKALNQDPIFQQVVDDAISGVVNAAALQESRARVRVLEVDKAESQRLQQQAERQLAEARAGLEAAVCPEGLRAVEKAFRSLPPGFDPSRASAAELQGALWSVTNASVYISKAVGRPVEGAAAAIIATGIGSSRRQQVLFKHAPRSNADHSGDRERGAGRGGYKQHAEHHNSSRARGGGQGGRAERGSGQGGHAEPAESSYGFKAQGDREARDGDKKRGSGPDAVSGPDQQKRLRQDTKSSAEPLGADTPSKQQPKPEVKRSSRGEAPATTAAATSAVAVSVPAAAGGATGAASAQQRPPLPYDDESLRQSLQPPPKQRSQPGSHGQPCERPVSTEPVAVAQATAKAEKFKQLLTELLDHL
jgi:hypothetical protein